MLLGLFVLIGAFTIGGETGAAAREAMTMSRSGLLRGEVWRLVTYAFITSSGFELLFKLLVFFYIAAPLEASWGTRRFLTLFCVSVIGGGLTAAAANVEIAGGWAVTMTLMLIHGFMFPNNVIYMFFILPVRVKTLAIFFTTVFLVGCATKGMEGLALFAGLFCGVLYYVLITRSIPWARKTARKAATGELNPSNIVKRVATDRIMERARKIIREHKQSGRLNEEDRIFIEELIRRSDPTHELCSPYSFSPDNQICPPCEEFGLCLRRYLETEDEEAEEAGS